MSEEYLKKVAKWEEELGDAVPRKVRLKLGVIFLFPLFLILIWFLLTAVIPTLLTALNANPHYTKTVAFILLIAVVMIFATFAANEKRSVQLWKKVIGKIQEVSLTRNGHIYEVDYKYGENIFRKRISEGNEVPKGDPGDPILLLVDPENPASCRAYGGSVWKAVKKDDHKIISS